MAIIHPQSFTLRQELVQLITIRKNIAPAQLLSKNFAELGFDTIDLVDIILEVEKAYQTYIPDEVSLNKVDDFVVFLSSQSTRLDA